MKTLQPEIKRIYYKYGTTLNRRITQNGGTLTDGQYTCTGDRQYMRLPIIPFNSFDNWEIQFTFTYNGGGTYPCFIAPSTQSYFLTFMVESGKFHLWYGSTSASSGKIDNPYFFAPVLGTTYHFKFGYTGEIYYLDYNTDGSSEYERIYSYTSTKKIYSNIALNIGYWPYTNATRWCKGPFDMPKFKVIANGKIFLSGTNVEIGTVTDYDFYRDTPVYRAKAKINRTYYKYLYEDESITTLPVYNTAIEGAAGIDGISFTPSTYIYNVIARNNNGYLPYSNDYRVTFTFEHGFVLKTWQFTPRQVANQMPYCSLTNVWGSNDGETWTSISNNSSNTTKYKYYQLKFVQADPRGYTYMGTKYLNMTGIITRRSIIAGTPEDYDFYRDEITCKGIK